MPAFIWDLPQKNAPALRAFGGALWIEKRGMGASDKIDYVAFVHIHLYRSTSILLSPPLWSPLVPPKDGQDGQRMDTPCPSFKSCNSKGLQQKRDRWTGVAYFHPQMDRWTDGKKVFKKKLHYHFILTTYALLCGHKLICRSMPGPSIRPSFYISPLIAKG